MSTQSKKTFGSTALVILAVLFLALTMLSSVVLRGARLDLTENKLYTISAGTKSIIADIDEPINLYFYFSDRASAEAPGLRAYAVRVRELLEELSDYGGTRLRLQVIDPIPFTEDEDDASRFGLQAIPLGHGGDTLYFGLAGTNALDDEATIPFFQPDKEAFLEYDLAKLIYSLDNPQRPVIGLVSGLPMSGAFDPATQRRREPWAIMDQIEGLFDVRNIAPAAFDHIDEDVSVLMVVHPKNLSEPAQYAIDQFVLGGGRVLVFVDPHAEVDVPPQDPSNPTAAMFAPRSSDLNRLFSAWGISYDPGQVVIDIEHALNVGSPQGGAPVPHLAVLGLDSENLEQDDLISGGLANLNVAFAGALGIAQDSDLEMTPLVTTGPRSTTTDAERFRFMPDPGGLLDEFAESLNSDPPAGEPQVLAARFQGALKSAFPGGPHSDLPDASAEDTDPESAAEEDEAPAGHMETSTGPVNLVVVADTDLLSDRMWVQIQNFFGQRLMSSFANNGDFAVNALDNLAGSNDLISIRGRATYSRPFERVEALKRSADARFRQTEQRLQDELRETEKTLTDLQSGRQDDDLRIMTPEQRAEIDKFREEQVRIRKELRGVRRELDSDIERLGAILKVVNIALVPMLLTIGALLFVFLRGRRREVNT